MEKSKLTDAAIDAAERDHTYLMRFDLAEIASDQHRAGCFWAVFSGAENEEGGTLLALFLRHEDARSYADGKDLNGEPLVFGPDIEPAILDGDAVIVGNDIKINDHEDLAAAITLYVAPEGG